MKYSFFFLKYHLLHQDNFLANLLHMLQPLIRAQILDSNDCMIFGLHYNHYVSPSVSPWSVMENAHNS